MNGIVNFLKPAMMTSHDAVYFFRKLTGVKKIGHTGTLDPMAVGVLPICIGHATRLIEYLEDDKEYRSIMKLGLTSDTGDIWSNKIKENDFVSPSNDEINKCLKSFVGRTTQKIPAFSAKKYKGRKLYELARKGEEIPEKSKQVDIKSVNFISYDRVKNEIIFDVKCSKGTYIRTICTDTGDKLGTGGVMSFLLRAGAGSFRIEDAVTIEELEKEMEASGNIDIYLWDIGKYLKNMKQIILNDTNGKKFVNGIGIEMKITDEELYAVFMKKTDGRESLLGIGKGTNNKLVPRKVIFRN